MITASAAAAFVIQTLALTATAFWAGWRLHHFASSLTATASTPGPSVTVTNEVRPTSLHIVQDLAAHAAYLPNGA